jgi:transcriptional regulator with XRE-family HTH domain
MKTIHNNLYIDLIEVLSQERKRLGLSQTEVAACLGMRQSEISKIESFERRLDILEFKELLKIYHIENNLHLKNLVNKFLGLL